MNIIHLFHLVVFLFHEVYRYLANINVCDIVVALLKYIGTEVGKPATNYHDFCVLILVESGLEDLLK